MSDFTADQVVAFIHATLGDGDPLEQTDAKAAARFLLHLLNNSPEACAAIGLPPPERPRNNAKNRLLENPDHPVWPIIMDYYRNRRAYGYTRAVEGVAAAAGCSPGKAKQLLRDARDFLRW